MFNLRDLSRIWLGMIATQSNVIDSREVAMQLWKNEVDRTIADRFVPHNHKDCTVCTILYSPVHLNCTVHCGQVCGRR